ncbi:ER membrane protein complex subunit 1, partial [Trichoplax sp. H2]
HHLGQRLESDKMALYGRISLFIFLLILNVCIHQSHCMYEDQIGSFDWHQNYVGKAKFIYVDQSSHSSRRLVIGSHSGAVATLNARTGAIVWRQVMERQDGQLNALLHKNKVLVSVSSQGRLFRRWDLNSGNILWESSLPMQSLSHKTLQSCIGTVGWKDGCIDSVTNDEVIATLIKNTLLLHSAGSGTIIKRIDLPHSNKMKYFAIYATKDRIYIVGAEDQLRLAILSYQRNTGVLSEQRYVQCPWISSIETSCLVIDGTLICTDISSESLQTINLPSKAESFQTHSLLVMDKFRSILPNLSYTL